MSCAALSAACAVEGGQPTTLLGAWEYRQANSASPTGVDREGERLEFERDAGGQLVARYYGLEREGEHGLFYTAVEATGVVVEGDGTVRLTVPARRLFKTRPASLEQAETLAPAGATKYELALTGRLADETLVIACSAAGGSCPDSRMVFRRLSSPPR